MAKVKGTLAAPFRDAAVTGRAASDDRGTVLSVFLLIPCRYSLFRAVAASGLS
jgi:hypothetical protein